MRRFAVLGVVLALAGCYIAQPLPDLGFSSTAEYLEWVRLSIRNAPDTEDEWSLPEVTLAAQSGDCEDKALLLLGLVTTNLGVDGYMAIGRIAGRRHAWTVIGGKICDSTLAADANPAIYDESMRLSYNAARAVAQIL